MSTRAFSEGQAFLSTVLIIGGMLIVIGATVAVVAATFIDSGYGLQASNQAESVAIRGRERRLSAACPQQRFFLAGGIFGHCSERQRNGRRHARIGPSAGLASVLSTATVNGRTRKISAAFSISMSTGQVILALWQDVQ